MHPPPYPPAPQQPVPPPQSGSSFKPFALGFGLGIVFVGLCFFVLLFALVAALGLGEQTVSIADNSVLVLELSGPLPEQAPMAVDIPFLLTPAGLTMLESWQLLEKAATDDRIEALVLDAGGLDAGWAKLEELRSQIVKFKEVSGKPVYAYLRGATSREYYVASAADKIYMGPQDWLDVKGLRAELMYIRGLLDKIGVEMEFESLGLYKDAPDQYTETGPSETTLEVMNLTLDQFYGNLIEVIAEGRGRPAEEIRALLNEGPFVAQNAEAVGLVDGLLFEDQFYTTLETDMGLESDGDDEFALEQLSAITYSESLRGESFASSRIAVVTADGEILPSGVAPGLSDVAITSYGMTQALREVREDDRIAGVILRVDSPGGDAVASDEILHEMKRLSEEKPVVISMSDYAASGGYMISMTGDPVLAYNNTQTGSIGVFFGKPNLRELYNKVGVNKYLMTRGQWSAIDSDYTPLGDAERAKLRGELEIYYNRFLELVSEGRRQEYATIAPLAEGRVWLGSQAYENGLVDEIGGIDRAVEMIREQASIDAEEEVSLIAYPRRQTLMEALFAADEVETSAAVSTLMGRWAADWVGVDASLKALEKLPLRSLTHGGTLELMPYSIDVQ